MADKQKELLGKLKDRFLEGSGIGETSVFTAAELDAPMDILRAEITEFGPDFESVLGEFFFLPIELEENTRYFTSVITISSMVPKESASDIAGVIARLNYVLPCGCFALGDEDKNLVFKYTAAVFADDDEESRLRTMYNAANLAMTTAEGFVGELILVMRNELTLEELMANYK